MKLHEAEEVHISTLDSNPYAMGTPRERTTSLLTHRCKRLQRETRRRGLRDASTPMFTILRILLLLQIARPGWTARLGDVSTALLHAPLSQRNDWPVIKDMLFMPFCLVLFLDRKPCFFACAFFVKTIRFSEVFFLPKILGREGGGGRGGRILGCALTPRWLELDFCVAAWPKGPQRRKSRGKGRDPLGQKHAAGELGSLLVTIVGHLSSR